MNLINDKKIAIIGGGPGGLTLARLLQQEGADVKVYERDLHANARVQGATLDLHEGSGLAALRRAGLMEAFEANYRPGADKLRLVNKQAEILMDDHENKLYDESRPEIDRGPLRQILLDSLQPGTVVWDSHFVKLVPHGNSWKLEFENGKEAFADVVIGADGGRSKIRPYITNIQAFYSGVTGVEGVVYDSEKNAPHIHKLLKGGKIFTLDDSKSLIISSKGDGSLAFYTGCKTDENWYRDHGIDFNDKIQVAKWFKEEFAGWDDIWMELFENAEPSFIPRPMYCMPLGQSWKAQPNLTMLGDAAHLMPPYAGEGVNMAMQDALELSECLANGNFPDLQSAIASYEKQMRARASECARDTLFSTDKLHSPEAVPFMEQVFNL